MSARTVAHTTLPVLTLKRYYWVLTAEPERIEPDAKGYVISTKPQSLEIEAPRHRQAKLSLRLVRLSQGLRYRDLVVQV